MNDIITSALNNNERFIKQFNLVPNIAYLTLLYYQFSYLQGLTDSERNKEDIVCSYYENNYQSPHVVIMSHCEDKKRYTLRRIRLKEGIYRDLEAIYKDDKQTPLDDDLLGQFLNLYEKYDNKIRKIK